MCAVAVAKHLHAMVAVFRYDDVPRAIKRYAPGLLELAGACSCAAKAAQVRPVAVPEHLNAMVLMIGHHQVALAIKRNAAVRTIKLPITSALAADDAREACARSCNRPSTKPPERACSNRPSSNNPSQPSAPCNRLSSSSLKPALASIRRRQPNQSRPIVQSKALAA